MSHSGSRQNNVRHKSHADIKGARMQSTTDKVGGEDEASESEEEVISLPKRSKNYVVNSSDEDWLDETFEKSNEAEDRFSAVDINNNNGKIQMVFKRQ